MTDDHRNNPWYWKYNNFTWNVHWAYKWGSRIVPKTVCRCDTIEMAIYISNLHNQHLRDNREKETIRMRIEKVRAIYKLRNTKKHRDPKKDASKVKKGESGLLVKNSLSEIIKVDVKA